MAIIWGGRDASAWAHQGTTPYLTIPGSSKHVLEFIFKNTTLILWCRFKDLQVNIFCFHTLLTRTLHPNTSKWVKAPSPTLVSVNITWSQGRDIELTATLWCPVDGDSPSLYDCPPCWLLILGHFLLSDISSLLCVFYFSYCWETPGLDKPLFTSLLTQVLAWSQTPIDYLRSRWSVPPVVLVNLSSGCCHSHPERICLCSHSQDPYWDASHSLRLPNSQATFGPNIH